MRTLDFTPLFRSTVGFDRMQRLIESSLRADESSQSYPPYNIEVTGDDAYQISMAVAGFGEEDLDITVKENSLVISGKARKPENEVSYLYRGIAGRSFDRRFHLADHIKVVDARLVNGILTVDLVREIPEEMKPRKIAISTDNGSQRKISKKAA
ncbi:MAG: Hsp20 family protein [Rhodospirillales bacterium]|nr:Hsp20 family protein [Rhodospirillales bacterium]